MRVGQVMTRKVEAVSPDAPLGVAARIMRDNNIGSLMVVEGGRLVGVITGHDIVVRAVAEGAWHERTRVGQVMSVEPVSCFEDQTLEEAERLMAEHGVRRLPVFNRRGRFVGVLSGRDLPGAGAARRPYRVTFYKRLATSYGQPRNVPLRTVYVAEPRTREDATAAAIARFEAESGARPWTNAADGYEVIEPR